MYVYIEMILGTTAHTIMPTDPSSHNRILIIACTTNVPLAGNEVADAKNHELACYCNQVKCYHSYAHL